jgi:hypothetical protein
VRRGFSWCRIAWLLLTPSKRHPVLDLTCVWRMEFALLLVLLDVAMKSLQLIEHWLSYSRHCQCKQQRRSHSGPLKLRQS